MSGCLRLQFPPPEHIRSLTLQSTEEFRKVVFGGQVTEEVDDPRKM
jgi:hypothetical protein